MKFHSIIAAVGLAGISLASATAHSVQPDRCAPLDFASNGEFRNVTAPGDVRILPTDKTVLINKRKPEATRVIFDRATPAHSPVVVVKDCSGTASEFPVKASGEIDAGEVSIDGQFGSYAFRRIGNRWMIQ